MKQKKKKLIYEFSGAFEVDPMDAGELAEVECALETIRGMGRVEVTDIRIYEPKDETP